jgi:plasmid stabilization system protein ParE
MARRIILRRGVADDLHSIVRYLDTHSTAAADRFVDAAFAAFDDLAQMPGKGSLKQLRVRRMQGLRSWWVPGFRKYLIYYHFNDEAIVILAVQHGSRKVRALLRKRMTSQ